MQASVVMREMGHTDPGLALKVYAQVMQSGESGKAQLRARVEGEAAPEAEQEAKATA